MYHQLLQKNYNTRTCYLNIKISYATPYVFVTFQISNIKTMDGVFDMKNLIQKYHFSCKNPIKSEY